MLRRAGWLICSILACACGGRVEESDVDAGESRDARIDTLIDEPVPPDPLPPPPDTGSPEVVFEAPKGGALTFVNASTVHPQAYFCLGAFLATDDPVAKDKPLAGFGPIGRPDPLAPTDPARSQPLRWGDAGQVPISETMEAALKSFTTVAWVVTSNPLTTTGCSETWRTVKTDPTRFHSIAKGLVPVDRSVVIAVTDVPEVTHVVLSPRRPIVEGDPNVVVDAIDLSRAPLPPRDIWLQNTDSSFAVLAKSSSYGSVSLAAPVERAYFVSKFRFVLQTAGSAPCITTDGKPNETCTAWSPVLGTIDTALSFGPMNALVWFGSPTIGSGPGSLRVVWTRAY